MSCFDRILLEIYKRRYKKSLLKRFKPKKRMKIRPLTNDIYAIRMKDGRYTYVHIPTDDSYKFNYIDGLKMVNQYLATKKYFDNKVDVNEEKLDQPKKDWLNKNKDKDPEELI